MYHDIPVMNYFLPFYGYYYYCPVGQILEKLPHLLCLCAIKKLESIDLLAHQATRKGFDRDLFIPIHKPLP